MIPNHPDSQQGMEDVQQKFAPGELAAVDGRRPEKYGKNASQTTLIPEKYQGIFKFLCQKVAIWDQFARIEEVKKAAIQRFYWRGNFDVCCNETPERSVHRLQGKLL